MTTIKRMGVAFKHLDSSYSIKIVNTDSSNEYWHPLLKWPDGFDAIACGFDRIFQWPM